MEEQAPDERRVQRLVELVRRIVQAGDSEPADIVAAAAERLEVLVMVEEPGRPARKLYEAAAAFYASASDGRGDTRTSAIETLAQALADED